MSSSVTQDVFPWQVGYLLRSSWILLIAVPAWSSRDAAAAPPRGQRPRRRPGSPWPIRSFATWSTKTTTTVWLEAFKTVEVRSRVRGHITKVHFNDGDIVKEGQPLFDLDPAPFEVEVKQAEAQMKAFEAQKVAAEKDVARYTESAASREAASQQQLEKAEADAESYDAQIAAKKAEVERFELDLKYAKITADLAGKISKAASDRRQPRQRRRERSAVDDDRGHRPDLRGFQRRRTRDAALPGDRRGPAGQGQATVAPRAEDPVLLRSGHGEGVSARGPSRFRGQQVRRGHGHDPRPRRCREP